MSEAIKNVSSTNMKAALRTLEPTGLSQAVSKQIIAEDYKGAFLIWADEAGMQGDDWFALIITLQLLPFIPPSSVQANAADA
ncbi:hypothetical protein [Telmatospirillum sp. J64-1]|uniref:hypothetical protein n=1 Tax=Telmatospirillum sp. J64-1 TaxID=2502183 RepID=UPI00115D594A|nr:hypothetical protein [Telmatospirillum sp. J64-1]